jgi:hypothetical protein
MEEVNLYEEMRRHQGNDMSTEITTQEIQPLSIESPITVQVERQKRSRRIVSNFSFIGMSVLFLIGLSIWFVRNLGSSNGDISAK